MSSTAVTPDDSSPTTHHQSLERMRVMFVVPYPTEAPSNRLRVEQYFPYLRAHGVKTRLRPFMASSFYRIRYRPGGLPRKAFSLAWSTVNRLLDLRRAGHFDVI